MKAAEKQFTTTQLSNRFGVSRQRVWQLARIRKCTPKMVGRKFALWSEQDAITLVPESFKKSEKAKL